MWKLQRRRLEAKRPGNEVKNAFYERKNDPFLSLEAEAEGNVVNSV